MLALVPRGLRRNGWASAARAGGFPGPADPLPTDLEPTRAGMEPWQAWVVVVGLGLMGLRSWMLGRRQRRARSDGAAKADDTSPE